MSKTVSHAAGKAALPREVLHALYLLITDYSAFSRNDRCLWFINRLLSKNSQLTTHDDTFGLLHGVTREDRVVGPDLAVLRKIKARETRNKTATTEMNKSSSAGAINITENPLDFRRDVPAPSLTENQTVASAPRPADFLSPTQSSEEDPDADTDERAKSAELPVSRHAVTIQMSQEEAMQYKRLSDSSSLKISAPPMTAQPFALSSQTRLRAFAAKYRLVFTLDVSPSMATINPVTGHVLFDELNLSLERIFTALVAPIPVPSTSFEFRPQIRICLIAQGTALETFTVLFHGITLTEETLPTILKQVQAKLRRLEVDIVKTTATTAPVSQSNDLSALLQNAAVALKLLPSEACPGIVLLTDGVTSIPDSATAYDSVIMLMNREDITCSVVQIGSGFRHDQTFGYVPDSDVLGNLVQSTGGALITSEELAELSGRSLPMNGQFSHDIACNSIQFDLLSRGVMGVIPSNPAAKKRSSVKTSPNNLSSEEFIVWDIEKLRMVASDSAFPWQGLPPPQPLFSVIIRQYQLANTNFLYLVDCRVQEGFQFHSFSNQDDVVTVKLILPWKANIKVVYNLKSVYRPENVNPTAEVNVTIDMLATYEFYQQFSAHKRMQQSGQQINNQTLAGLLLALLAHLNDTDRHLESMVAQTATTAPELDQIRASQLMAPSARSGVSQRQAVERNFWKGLSVLTKNNWHRWFRTERMEVTLLPDRIPHSDAIELKRRPVDPEAHNVTYEDAPKFTYRKSQIELHRFFENWSTLAHSRHTYAKVFAYDCNSNPSEISFRSVLTQGSSFCVIRLAWDAPNVCILNMFFFSLAPSDKVRVLTDLKAQLSAATSLDGGRAFAICRAPLRLLMMNYNLSAFPPLKKPSMLRNLELVPTMAEAMELIQLTEVDKLAPTFKLLSRYLKRRRWIWPITNEATRKGAIEAVVQTRVRDGFVNIAKEGHDIFWQEVNLVSAGAGPVRSVVQFVIFAVDNFVITELAMEPQEGTFPAPFDPKLDPFEEFARLVFQVDYNLVSQVVTFDHLAEHLSQNHRRPLTLMTEPEFVHGVPGLSAESTVVLVALNLGMLVKAGIRKDESFVSFDSGEGQKEKNELLYGVLGHILANMSSAILPASPEPKSTAWKDLHGWAKDYRSTRGLTIAQFLRLIGSPDTPTHVVYLSRDPSLAPSSKTGSIGAQLRLDLQNYRDQCPTFAGAPELLATDSYLELFCSDFFGKVLTTEHLALMFLLPLDVSNSSSKKALRISVVQCSRSAEADPASTTELRRLLGSAAQSYTKEKLAHTLSTQARGFLSLLHHEYLRGFVRALYTHLRENQSVSTADFEYAMRACHETALDVDITHFLRMFKRLRKSGGGASNEAQVEAQFAQVFGEVFVRVPNSKQFFFYSPPLSEAQAVDDEVETTLRLRKQRRPVGEVTSPRDTGDDEDNDNEEVWNTDTDLAALPTASQTSATRGVFSYPFFVRMECVLLTKSEESTDSASASKPSSTSSRSNEGDSDVFPVNGLPMPKSHPHLHTALFTRATLRIQCVVLPRETIDKSAFEASDNPEVIPITYNRLPKRIRSIMKDAHRRVRSVVAQHILTCLREKLPVTKSQLDSITSYMEVILPPAVIECPVPLWFIFNPEGRTLFLQELEATKLLQLDHVDKYFFIVERQEGGKQAYTIPYWLIMTVTNDTELLIRFLASPLLTREEFTAIKRKVISAVSSLTNRVNQLLLLNALHDTRTCNILLVPENGEEVEAATQADGIRLQYGPGCFKCDLKHEMTLKIFHRLDANEALGQLVATSMFSFSVANRKNMFVIREQNGNVFYLFLVLARMEEDGSIVPLSAATTAITAAAPASSEVNSDFIVGNTASTTKLNLNTSASKTKTATHILIRVHGVGTPGKEITQALLTGLEAKLANLAVQNLSKLLLRNPLLKLSPADLELLRPSDQKPRTFAIDIPGCVQDSSVFYALWRQNLLKQYLSVMNVSADTATSPAMGPLLPSDSIAIEAPHCADTAIGEEFLYNNLIGLQGLPAKFNFGQGMACLHVQVCNASNGVNCADQANSSEIWGDFADAKAHPSDSAPATKTTVPSLFIRLWTRGTIKDDELLAHLAAVVNQSVVEYQIETNYGIAAESLHLNHIPVGPWVGSSEKLLQRAAELGAPSVRHLATAALTPSWAMKAVLTQLKQSLFEVSPQLASDIYMGLRPEEVPKTHLVGREIAPPNTTVYRNYTFELYKMAPSSKGLGGPATQRRNIADPNQLLFRQKRVKFAIVASKHQSAASTDQSPEVSEEKLRPSAPLSASPVRQEYTYYAQASVASKSAGIASQEKVLARRCFALLTVTAQTCAIMTYNWNSTLNDALVAHITQLNDWVRMRQNLLGNVLSQKMGLFHFSPTIDQDLANSVVGMISASEQASLGPGASSTPTSPAALGSTGSSNPGARVAKAGGKADSSATRPPPGPVNALLGSTAGGMARTGSNPSIPTANPGPIGMKFNRFKALPTQIPVTHVSSSGSSTATAQPPSSNAPSTTANPITSTKGAATSSGQPTQKDDASTKSSTSGSGSSSSIPSSAAATSQPSPPVGFRFGFDMVFDMLTYYPIPPSAKAKPIKRPTRVDLPFDGLLRRITPRVLPGRKLDPVVRHAEQFQYIASRQRRTAEVEKVLSKVCLQWAKTKRTQADTTITEAELLTIRKASRILHTVRVAFFLPDLYRNEVVLETLPPMSVRLIKHAVIPSASNKDEPPPTTPVAATSTAPVRRPSTAGAHVPTIVTTPTSAHPFTVPKSVPPFPSVRPGDVEQVKSFLDATLAPEQRLKLDSPTAPSTQEKPSLELKQRWKRRLVQLFIEEYSKYLNSFGLHQIEIQRPASTKPIVGTPAHVEDSKKDELPDTIYFQRVFRGGLYLVSLSCKGMFITLDVFTFFSFSPNYVPGWMSSSPLDKCLESILVPANEFTFLHSAKFLRGYGEECGRLKETVHLNSFVYDFHIRQLTTFLESGSYTDYPGDEFVNMLQSLVLYCEPPRYSRNAIRSESLRVELGPSLLSPLEIFAFLARKATQYSFYSMAERGVYPAVFLVSNRADMVNKPRNTKQQWLDDGMEEDSYCLVAFVTDANYNPLNVDNVNLGAQTAWLRWNLQAHTHRQASPPLASPPTPAPTTPTGEMTVSGSLRGFASLIRGSASMRNLGDFASNALSTAAASPTPSTTTSPNLSASKGHGSVSNMAGVVQAPKSRQVEGKPAPSPALGAQTAASPPTHPVSGNANAGKHFNISYFVLRTNKVTPFPLPITKVKSEAKGRVERSDLSDALHKSESRLMEVTRLAYVHSERDLLWNKLIHEGSAYEAAISNEQMKLLMKLVVKKELDTFDTALREVLALSIDWAQLVSHLVSAYQNRVRQFHFDHSVHLVVINQSDVDALLHISVHDNTGFVTLGVLRRDGESLVTPEKQTLVEAQQVSHLVNTISHWLWRSMINRDKKPK